MIGFIKKPFKTFLYKIRERFIGGLRNEIENVKIELQNHKEDKCCFEHYSLRQYYDYTIANLQLGVMEQIVPGNKERLERFRDSHKGEFCFVIGNGSSLTAADLNALHENGVFCLASNRIHLIFEETAWRPDVWGVTDGRAISSFKGDFSVLDGIVKFTSVFSAFRDNTQIPGAIYFPHIMSNRLPFWLNKDICCGVIDYPTITGVLINIAAYMGFSEIYLLGVDNTIGATKVNEDGIKYYDMQKIKHFSETYTEGIPDVIAWDFSIQNKNRLYRDLAVELAVNHNIKLLNATRGGEMDIERVKFEDVLRGKAYK